MPGYAREMADFGARREGASLGKPMESFIDNAIPDFTHMTVLIYLVREGREGVTVGEVSKIIGDPKRVVQAVFERFLKLDMVRVEAKLLSKKYHYQREGARAHLVSKLLKLWEHKEGHEIVLRRILATKP